MSSIVPKIDLKATIESNESGYERDEPIEQNIFEDKMRESRAKKKDHNRRRSSLKRVSNSQENIQAKITLIDENQDEQLKERIKKLSKREQFSSSLSSDELKDEAKELNDHPRLKLKTI